MKKAIAAAILAFAFEAERQDDDTSLPAKLGLRF
jgi:hypothetical protein